MEEQQNQQPQFQFNKTLADQETINYWQQCTQLARQDVNALVQVRDQLSNQHQTDSERIIQLEADMSTLEGVCAAKDETITSLKSELEMTDEAHKVQLAELQGCVTAARDQLADALTARDGYMDNFRTCMEHFRAMLKEMELVRMRTSDLRTSIEVIGQPVKVVNGGEEHPADKYQTETFRQGAVDDALDSCETLYKRVEYCINTYLNLYTSMDGPVMPTVTGPEPGVAGHFPPFTPWKEEE